MTNKTPLAITSALLLAVPVAIFAQNAYHADPANAGAGASGKQGGGKGVTLQQFEQRRERKIMALDTDGDGRISRAEFLAGSKAGKGDPAKRFAKLDRNGDGFIDKGEIEARLAKRFHHLDTNGDGVLSAQERAAGRHHGAGRAGAGQTSPAGGDGAAS